MKDHFLKYRQPRYYQLADKKYSIKGQRLQPQPSNLTKSLNNRIWVNGIEIFPESAFVLRPFYECTFDWGPVAGLSAFTAALSICLSIFKEERMAENVYECFKNEFVNHFSEGDFEVSIDLTAFLKKFHSRLHPALYSRFCYAALLDSREILMYRDPRSGLITVNLLENYAIASSSISDEKLRTLIDRKRKLVFQFFVKERHLITGYDFDQVMSEIEEIMARFYWQSLERLIRKKIRPEPTQRSTSSDQFEK